MYGHDRSQVSMAMSSSSHQRSEFHGISSRKNQSIMQSHHSETHRSEIHHVSGVPSTNQWHSATNTKGNLVIAKNSDLKKSKTPAQIRAEKRIFSLVTDYKVGASRSEIAELSSNLMKVMEKYKRGDYDESSRRTTTDVASARMQLSKAKPIMKSTPKSVFNGQTVNDAARMQSLQTKKMSKSTLESTPKNVKTVGPKLVSERIDQKVDGAQHDNKKIPKELLRLLNSDGFVVTPIRDKRPIKTVERFDEMMFEGRLTRLRSKTMSSGVDRPIQKKIVKAKPTPSKKRTATVTSSETGECFFLLSSNKAQSLICL